MTFGLLSGAAQAKVAAAMIAKTMGTMNLMRPTKPPDVWVDNPLSPPPPLRSKGGFKALPPKAIS